MGTLFSGVGLISGLDISSLVDGLISVSARPRDGILARIGTIDAQKTAFLDISARITAMLTRVAALKQSTAFNANTVSSSEPDVLSAEASASAPLGSFDFVVRQLATTHQLVSRGFHSTDDTLAPGTFTLESAQARTNIATLLDELNGYTGVQRGSFKLIDGAGNEAVISVGGALTLDDLIERINGAGLTIRADIRSDAIRLTETSGQALRIEEVDDGHVAADLGFGAGNTSSTAGELLGGTLIELGSNTPLSALNDGNGIFTNRAGGDFNIIVPELASPIKVDLSGLLLPATNLAQLNRGNGASTGTIRISTFSENDFELKHDIDLSGATTIQDVQTLIQDAVPGVVVSLNGSRLAISYDNTVEGAKRTQERIAISDVGGGTTARDLGIVGDEDSGTITGKDILTMESVGDVLAAINHAAGNDGTVTAEVVDMALVIKAPSTISLQAINGSGALLDLGFEERDYKTGQVQGRRMLGGVNTVLLSTLNGGRGFQMGSIQIDVAGTPHTFDLSAAETLQDVIDIINDAAAQPGGPAISAGHDRTGTRLVIKSIDGVTPLTITDVKGAGTFAKQAGLTQAGAAVVRSENLQRRYISLNTALKDLNAGAGITLGQVRLTNADGIFVDVDLTGAKTLGEVVNKINQTTISSGQAFSVRARINDTGDGLLLEDSSTGAFGLKVEDRTGSAGRDLLIAGESDSGVIDGSFELRIDVSASDTVLDLVNRISDETTLAQASILDDGSKVNPLRIQINSALSGRAGELIIDDAGLGIDIATLSQAQDALISVGSDPNGGLTISSSTNTFDDVVPGITLNVTGVSDSPVSVTVSRDLESVIEAIDGMVSSFNAAVERIDDLTKYDSETETAAVLLGDGAVRLIDRRLFNSFIGRIPGAAGAYQRLSDVGIRLKSGSLTFDKEKFRETFEADPQGVTRFFTDAETGAAQFLEQQIKGIVDPDGLIENRGEVLDRRKELLNDRVERMNALLDSKRARLTRQFQAMETALGELQAQQSALGQLAAIAGGLRTGG